MPEQGPSAAPPERYLVHLSDACLAEIDATVAKLRAGAAATNWRPVFARPPTSGPRLASIG